MIVCGANGVFRSGRGVGCNKIGAAQCCAIRVLFIDFDFSCCLYKLRYNDLCHSFRIIALRHTDDGTELRPTVIADMGHKVDPVIVTGIHGNMSNSTIRDVFENDQRANGDGFARHKIITVSILPEADAAGCSGTDPFVCRCIIGRSRAKIIGPGHIAGVDPRNVRQIIEVHIRHIRGAAKTAAFKCSNVRCEAGRRSALGNGFGAVSVFSIGDIREIRTGSTAEFLEDRAVVLLLLDFVAGVLQRIQIDVVQHIGRNIRCRCRQDTRWEQRNEHQHRHKQRQQT